MADFDDLYDDVKRYRDEIRVRLHLGSMEAREEWDRLESKWDSFNARAKTHESAEGVSDALEILGEELKAAYGRFRNALKD